MDCTLTMPTTTGKKGKWFQFLSTDLWSWRYFLWERVSNSKSKTPCSDFTFFEPIKLRHLFWAEPLYYKKHKIYLYKEDFTEFSNILNEMTDYVISEKGEEVISERHQKDFKKEDNTESTDILQLK